jgi:hypothetical protein
MPESMGPNVSNEGTPLAGSREVRERDRVDEESPPLPDGPVMRVTFDPTTLAAASKAFGVANRPFYKKLSAYFTALTLVVSLTALGVSIYFSQNAATTQEVGDLFTVSQDLSEVPSQLATIQHTYAADPTDAAKLQRAVTSNELIQAQQGWQLIQELGNNAPPPEIEQVGLVLEQLGDNYEGVNLVRTAAYQSTDGDTRASSFQALGQSLYELHEVSPARTAMKNAEAAYSGVPNTDKTVVSLDGVTARLLQVPFEVNLGHWASALSDYHEARKLLSKISHNAASTSMYAQEAKREAVTIETQGHAVVSEPS